MNDKIKNCPFCDSKPKKFVRTHIYGNGYGTVKDIIGFGCANKKCYIKPRIEAKNENIEKQIELWNDRNRKE